MIFRVEKQANKKQPGKRSLLFQPLLPVYSYTCHALASTDMPFLPNITYSFCSKLLTVSAQNYLQFPLKITYSFRSKLLTVSAQNYLQFPLKITCSACQIYIFRVIQNPGKGGFPFDSNPPPRINTRYEYFWKRN